MGLIERAKNIATKYHAGQKRRYTGEPYINHLGNVAHLCAMVSSRQDIQAIAWLHDILEDTDCTAEELNLEFGEHITAQVLALTDPHVLEGNRATRKEMVCKKLELADEVVKTVKLADLIDNMDSIVEHDPDFARVYLGEKRKLLFVLEGGNQPLYCEAMLIWRQAMAQLEEREG